MPRQSVYKYECDRCGRTWFPEVEDGKDAPETKKLELRLEGPDGTAIVEVKYDTLCESCEKTVENYVQSVAKDLKKNSPKRGAKKKDKKGRGAEAPHPQPVEQVKPPSTHRQDAP
jgi:hypothetical protein